MSNPIERIGLSLALAAIALGFAFFGDLNSGLATPTNFRSTVLDIAPTLTGAEVMVVGGDAFLEVTAHAGHVVLVPGYFGEPYVRIDDGGRVLANAESPAYYLNMDRYGESRAPAGVDGTGEPRWQTVGENGTFAWLDHRIHWMSRDLPPSVAGDRLQIVYPWEVPVVVDGTDHEVRGELVWVPSRSPYPPLLAAVICLLPLVLGVGGRQRALIVLSALAILTAAVLSGVQSQGTPDAIGAAPLGDILLVAGSSAALGVSIYARRRKRHGVAAVGLAVAGAGLAAWSFHHLGSLWLPILPNAGAPDFQRLGMAAIGWIAVAALIVPSISNLERFRGERTG